MKKLTLSIVSALIAVVLAFVFVLPAHAMMTPVDGAGIVPSHGSPVVIRPSSDDVELPVIVASSGPVIAIIDTTVIIPVITDNTPVIVPQPTETQPASDDKEKCNKGSGNGAEGCDPGNHPENGNDDETPE